jgi:CubicO group peptidase (beta-lactamase class C family)
MAKVSNVNASVNTGEVAGFCDPRFELVAQEFVRNFQERGEVGASVCVTLEGETVVDLWGGSANPTTNTPWREDTVSIVWSSTKGATALCAHILAVRGELDLDAPVVHYWPEFGQAGKETIPVTMLLNHQSGVAAIRDPLPEGAFNDWELMTTMLAKQEPFWRPGTMHGYQAFTFGWLVGEIVRRVSGKSVGTFFREEVAEPLGIDFWIGLPEVHEPRVAPIIPADPPSMDGPISPFYAALAYPTSLQTLAFFNSGGYMLPNADGVFGFNQRADPAARMSFGYSMNRMGQGVGLNERGQSLVNATYRSLGYASNASGTWQK